MTNSLPRALIAVAVGLLLLPAGLLAGAARVHADDRGKNAIEIKASDRLEPSVLQVPAGSAVTWVNDDGATHRLIAEAASAGGHPLFDSGPLAKDATFIFTFASAGTFRYELGTAAAGSWEWWSGGSVDVTGGTSIAPTPAPTTGPTPTPSSAAASILIFDNYFNPATLSVTAGTQVTWTNRGGSEHTVTSAGLFDSGVVGSGGAFSFRFAAPGTYAYLCQIHSGMRATILVTGSAPVPGPSPTAPPPVPTPVAPPSPQSLSVAVNDNFFQPSTLDIPVGSRVTWTNQGSAWHTVSAGLFDSSIVKPGSSFSFAFDTPGTFAYLCHFHAGMAGTIRVSGPDGTPAPPATSASSVASSAPTSSGPGPSAGVGATLVSVGDNFFNPASVVVTTGSTVTWINQGQVMHTVTAIDGSFDSGLLANTGRFAFTFRTAGIYRYRCDIHAGMVGVLQVAASSGASASLPEVTPSASPSRAPIGAAHPGTNRVAIGDNFFDPSSLKVPAGTSVTWVNQGQVSHTVTLPGRFDSGLLRPGARFSHRFDAAGTYRYLCALHPHMEGVVEVTGAAPATAPPTSGGSNGFMLGLLLGSVLATGAAVAVLFWVLLSDVVNRSASANQVSI